MKALPTEKKKRAFELKPFDHINNIIAHTLPFAEHITLPKGENIHYYHNSARQCFLLLQGNLALHRRCDGTVLNSESAPFVLGVSNQFSSEDLYVKVLEKSEIARISLAYFNQIVANKNLWESFSNLLIYTASRAYEHCVKIAQASAYDIIRFQLVALMNEQDTYRKNITAVAYIKNHSNLSRSGIMRILAELRTGEYITMQRGVLLEIRHLPRRY
ncbi:helix-turn-helix domain-containing protein [Lelliottia sp. RWM.1]|uniref:helix-turn-helix domain-containing protein n=1 Tax=Lelliottia sp. RWM.1 TaxID=2663242 RepID=UPI00193C872C|nr:helix-turn-helix domain-containing protein [Lelliottia sp. RWM.1]MBM3070837.1 cyclic nucleotide-binding protein [Lelliottia sp. RWM.1]